MKLYPRFCIAVDIGTKPRQCKRKCGRRSQPDVKGDRFLHLLEPFTNFHILGTLENHLVPQILPRLRHFHLFAVVVKQRALVEVLQILDMLGHRGLCQVENRSRLGIAFGFTQGQKRVHSII